MIEIELIRPHSWSLCSTA